MKQLNVRSSSSDQTKHDASKRHMRWNSTGYIQKSLDILNASLTCACNYLYTFKCLICHPTCSLQGKPKNYVYHLSPKLFRFIQNPPGILSVTPDLKYAAKRGPRRFTHASVKFFLFFFTKLQPMFSFPSSLLALPWDLLGSLIGGFSLSKNQRTVFNLAIIKLINLDALRGTVCCFF